MMRCRYEGQVGIEHTVVFRQRLLMFWVFCSWLSWMCREHTASLRVRQLSTNVSESTQHILTADAVAVAESQVSKLYTVHLPCCRFVGIWVINTLCCASNSKLMAVLYVSFMQICDCCIFRILLHFLAYFSEVCLHTLLKYAKNGVFINTLLNRCTWIYKQAIICQSSHRLWGLDGLKMLLYVLFLGNFDP